MLRLTLNKEGLKIISTVLVSTTILTSCGKVNNNRENSRELGNNQTNYYTESNNENYNNDIWEDANNQQDIDNYYNNYNTYNEVYLTNEQIQDLKMNLRTMVTISDDNLKNFNNYLLMLEDYYHYDDLFGIDEALNLYCSEEIHEVVNHKGDFIGKDNRFTYDEIYNIVLNNNKRYQGEDKINFYRELDNSQLEQICKIITNTLNDYLAKGLVQNIGELSCILSNLKILRDDISLSNAYVTDDDCLLISPNMLNIMNLFSGKDSLLQTVTHEVEHLLQKSCQDSLKEESKTIGICTKYTNLKVNPLFFDWFYEASAEKEACNYMNCDAIVYKNMIGYLESLSISTILYDDVLVNQTERLSMQKDLNKLFEQFHCETIEDRKNIIKMMFAIDIIQNEDEEFMSMYENAFGISLYSNDILNIKYELKPDICRTYLKSFYKSLGEAIKDKSVPLEDIFYLMRLVEADINNHILYQDSNQDEYNREFINESVKMQEEFFQSLNTKYSVSELNQLYQNYQLSYTTTNEALKWLNSSKREYLQERASALMEYSKISMQQVNEALNNQKIK